MRRHLDICRGNLLGRGGSLAAHCWTVDEAENLALVQALVGHFPPWPAIPSVEDVIHIADDPALP